MKSIHELKRLDGTKLYFIGKGILIGISVGFVVSLFRLSISYFFRKVLDVYEILPHYPILLIPWILFSIFIAYIIGKLIKSDPNIKGSGIPQIEGQLRGQLSIGCFSILWKKFIGAVLGLSLGLFLGREGPSIQLGSAVAQVISEKIGSTKVERKILISSGASAGLSAAFNAPIAGLLFVLEEVHHSFSPLVLLTAFSATITSNFVSLYFFGLRPVLYIGAIKTFPLYYYWTLIILGIFVGLLGLLYQKTLLKTADLYKKVSFLSSNFYGVIPVLLVIPIGFFFPKILGGGHEIILQLTDASLGIFILLVLFIIRFCFSMISYGSGVPGGIFLPILSLGAIAGVIFGSILVQFFGVEEIYMKNFLIFAMAGYFAAISKAPLTSIVLITEMIGSFSHLMSIGVVVLISYIVVDFFNGKPIYESLLEKLIKSPHFDINGKKTIIEFPVVMESSFDDQMVRDIHWPKDMLLTSLRRGEKEILTHGDTVIHAGDTLIILTDDGISQKIKDFLTLESQLTT